MGVGQGGRYQDIIGTPDYVDEYIGDGGRTRGKIYETS